MPSSLFPRQKYNEGRELDKIAQLYQISGMDRSTLKRLVIQAVWAQGASNMPLREEMTRLAQSEPAHHTPLMPRQRKVEPTAARLQLVPIKHVEGFSLDPAVRPDPYLIYEAYGPRQTRLILQEFTPEFLNPMVETIKRRNPNTRPKGTSNSAKIDYIMYHLEHQEQAREQKEAPMSPREKRLAERASKRTLLPKHRVEGYKIDPFAPPDPYFIRATFGDEQFADALTEQTLAPLKGMAHKLMRDNPDSGKPRNESSKQDLIDYIVTTVRAHPKRWDGKRWVDAE